MKIDRLDHVVLTVKDIDATCRFYVAVLGMDAVSFGQGRKALVFGEQKLNLQTVGHEIPPHALHPTSGAVDLCLIASTPITEVLHHLRACNVEVVAGPVERVGAIGKLLSVYFRDPDQNVIEVANYL